VKHRLVAKVKAKGGRRRTKGTVLIGNEHGPAPPAAYGIEVDGERFQLGGQPPVATTKGWGRVPGT